MQARTTFPFTSISQAPQLPPMQPVGMETPAPVATTSQSLPTISLVIWPFGQVTLINLLDEAWSLMQSMLPGLAQKNPHPGEAGVW